MCIRVWHLSGFCQPVWPSSVVVWAQIGKKESTTDDCARNALEGSEGVVPRRPALLPSGPSYHIPTCPGRGQGSAGQGTPPPNPKAAVWLAPKHPPKPPLLPGAPNPKAAWLEGAPNPKAAWLEGAPNPKAAWLEGAPNPKAAWLEGAPNPKAAWLEGAPKGALTGGVAAPKSPPPPKSGALAGAGFPKRAGCDDRATSSTGSWGCCEALTGGRFVVLARPRHAVEPLGVGRFHRKLRSSCGMGHGWERHGEGRSGKGCKPAHRAYASMKWWRGGEIHKGIRTEGGEGGGGGFPSQLSVSIPNPRVSIPNPGVSMPRCECSQ